MKFLYYIFNEEIYKTKKELQKAIKEFKKDFEPDQSNMIVKPFYEYFKIYEFEDGVNADTIYQYTGVELDENNKYVFIPVKEYFSAEENLKKKYIGYKLLDYLEKNGEEVKIYNVYDGFVYKFECDNKVILIGDDFGVLKGKCLSRKEFEEIFKGN